MANRKQFRKLKARLAATRGTFKTRSSSLGVELDGMFAQIQGEFQNLFAALELAGRDDFNAIMEAEARQFFDDVEDGTPVDTGRARAGWRFSVESTSTDGGVEFIVVNDVPYIVWLEYGWSQQAPAGMVRINLVLLNQRLRRSVEAYLG